MSSNILSSAYMSSLCAADIADLTQDLYFFTLDTCRFETFSIVGMGDISIIHPLIATNALYCMKCILICGQYLANPADSHFPT